MNPWEDSNLLSEWLHAFGVIAAMLIATAFSREFLHWLGKKRWKFLTQLAPSISNLIYLIGFKLFIEVAPLNPKIAAWLESVVYILGVLILLGLIRRAALISVEWGAYRSNQSTTLQQGFIPLMRNVITLFMFATGGIMILKHFNYDVMSLVTALGVGSLAVGLAAKDTLSNMISGFTLIIDRNLRPGDRIDLSGSIGTVEEIGLRSTRIRLGNGNTLIVPNTELVNTKIMNLSLPSAEVTCSTKVQVSCAFPFAKVKAVCLATIDETEKARKDMGRWVHLSALNDGHQVISIGFWVSSTDDTGPALSDFHEKLLSNLAHEKISLVGSIAPAPTA
ncbi:MAG TPA: mechanosensitive ion channel domain-containing protein [Bdellovibrionota bacterium]|nr:mechanosensitive ion channel domain-containing protein [Bdellovibrionota bacterium]